MRNEVWQTARDLYGEIGKSVLPVSCHKFHDHFSSFIDVPTLQDVEDYLSRFGWRTVETNGFLSFPDYFKYLSQETLPISFDIRNKEQLDFVGIPDIVHELYGHAAHFENAEMRHLMKRFGEKGRINPSKIDKLAWWALETLVLDVRDHLFPVGAIPLSSTIEFKRALNRMNLRPLTEEYVSRHFAPSDLQPYFCTVKSFDEIWHLLERH